MLPRKKTLGQLSDVQDFEVLLQLENVLSARLGDSFSYHTGQTGCFASRETRQDRWYTCWQGPLEIVSSKSGPRHIEHGFSASGSLGSNIFELRTLVQNISWSRSRVPMPLLDCNAGSIPGYRIAPPLPLPGLMRLSAPLLRVSATTRPSLKLPAFSQAWIRRSIHRKFRNHSQISQAPRRRASPASAGDKKLEDDSFGRGRILALKLNLKVCMGIPLW